MDKYVYMDDRGYMIGLPARDIPFDEWMEYPKELREAAIKQRLYILVQEEKREVKEHAKRS